MSSRRRLLGLLAVAFPAVFLSACAGAPKPPPPTIIQGIVEVAPGVNPDSSGRASPIVVKVFELKSLAAFGSADFFSLFEKDQATLGAELTAREDMQLAPRDTRKFERKAQPETRYIGVIAAFRDLEHAKWRGAVAIPPEKVTRVTIRLDARSVSVTAAQ